MLTYSHGLLYMRWRPAGTRRRWTKHFPEHSGHSCSPLPRPPLEHATLKLAPWTMRIGAGRPARQDSCSSVVDLVREFYKTVNAAVISSSTRTVSARALDSEPAVEQVVAELQLQARGIHSGIHMSLRKNMT